MSLNEQEYWRQRQMQAQAQCQQQQFLQNQMWAAVSGQSYYPYPTAIYNPVPVIAAVPPDEIAWLRKRVSEICWQAA